jgi:protein-disulfide isomerase
MGAADAKVTMVELTDYECPFCARAENTVQALRKSYGRDLRVVVAESPLPMHEHADEIAAFALMANEAGVFEQAHSSLFAEPNKHSDADLDALGRKLGMGGFLRSPAAMARAKNGVEKSEALARTLHVTGTPTFFVNGRMIAGAQPVESFRAIIDEELAHADELVAEGVTQNDLYAKVMDEARKNPARLGGSEPPPEEAFLQAAVGASGLHLMGDRKAAHELLLFTDMECPFCARLDAQLRSFVQAHPDVKVVVRQRPLPMHPNARTWAKAAIAADAQGKVSAFMEKAFAERADRSVEALDRIALAAGLDVARMHRDMESDTTAQTLKKDEALAETLGVTGTPTSFLDGYKVVGAQPSVAFTDALKKATARR